MNPQLSNTMKNPLVLSKEEISVALAVREEQPECELNSSLHSSSSEADTTSCEIASQPIKTNMGGNAELLQSRPVAKPKRALTAYNLFFRDHRNRMAKLRRETPDCPSIAKMISIVWKRLDPTQRAHYDMLAAKEKFRHYIERQAWLHYKETQKILKDESSSAETSSEVSAEATHDDKEAAPLPMEGIANIASKLDPESIDFLIRALS